MKASPGACKSCLREEGARSDEGSESTIAVSAAAPAVVVSDSASSVVAGRYGGVPRTHQKKCSSGAWLYYPDGYFVEGSEVRGLQIEGAFLVVSYSQMI